MQKIIRICLSEDEDDRCVILGDDGCLLTPLSTAVRENMGLDEDELEDVESYISELQCDDDTSISSSSADDTGESEE